MPFELRRLAQHRSLHAHDRLASLYRGREQTRDPGRGGVPEPAPAGHLGAHRNRADSTRAPKGPHREVRFVGRWIALEREVEVGRERETQRVETRAEVGARRRNPDRGASTHRAPSLGTGRLPDTEALRVAEGQELEQLTVGVAYEQRATDIGIGEHLTAELGDPRDDPLEIAAQRHVRESGIVHRSRGVRTSRCSREVQELEHEPVALEVERGHAQRGLEPEQADGGVVGRLQLTDLLELEELDVEAPCPGQVGDALTHVIEGNCHSRMLAHQGFARQRPANRAPSITGEVGTGTIDRMRVCARSDCSSPAAAILTYDRVAQTAYLFAVDDPTTRSPGDLCERHLQRLVLPRSWCLDDRREPIAPTGTAQSGTVLTRTPRSATKARAKAGHKWAEVGPSLFDPSLTEDATETAPVVAVTPITAVERDARDQPESTEHAWMPHFGPDTELDDVLDASTPLLRRAFGGG